jgi:hypothetical protein
MLATPRKIRIKACQLDVEHHDHHYVSEAPLKRQSVTTMEGTYGFGEGSF